MSQRTILFLSFDADLNKKALAILAPVMGQVALETTSDGQSILQKNGIELPYLYSGGLRYFGVDEIVDFVSDLSH